VGSRVHVTGKLGSFQSGPRIVATLVQTLGEVQATQLRQIGGALTAQLEWQLVQASGRIDRITRVGVRWRADLLVAGRSVAVLGEPAAGIAASAVLPGHMAVVVGIVRRSTSNSGEFELLPRSSLDLRLGPSLSPATAQSSAAASGPSIAAAVAARENISSLAGRLGRQVVVSGLVVDAESGSATVDDGTGRVRIGGAAAADAISLLEPGDAIEVAGLVRQDAQGWLIEADPGTIVALAAIGDGPSLAASGIVGLPVDRPADRAAATMQPALLTSSSPWLAAALVVLLLLLAGGLAGALWLRSRGSRVAWPAALRRPRLGRTKASGGPEDQF
jgi:hypothetical protein